MPWVASAALSSEEINIAVPAGGSDAVTSIVSSGYFGTLGIAVVAGRDFSPGEASGGASVAIVSAATARALWPRGDAVGKSFDVDSFDLRHADLPWDEAHTHLRVVGVSADVITGALWKDVDRSRLYLPGVKGQRQHLLVRLAQADGAGTARVAAFFSRGGRGERVLATGLDEDLANYRYLARGLATLSVSVGALMFVLALSGMYSMFALTTELRMREFAIRLAIGASPRSLFATVTGSAVLLAVAGGAIGLAIFLGLDLFVLPELEFPLRGSRLVVYAAVPMVMWGVGFGAAFAPGVRASRSEAARLLRESSG
jgi:ABC-type antimicrobial peptide transport system permease subunit